MCKFVGYFDLNIDYELKVIYSVKGINIFLDCVL